MARSVAVPVRQLRRPAKGTARTVPVAVAPGLSGRDTDASARALRGGSDAAAHHALLGLMELPPLATMADVTRYGDLRGENQAIPTARPTSAKRTQTQPSKKRKATHTIRNEEIATLSKEISRLSRRLAFVRGQALETATTSGNTEQNPDGRDDPRLVNPVLREAIQEQQLWLARARSMVAEYVVNDFVLPAHCYIHLTRSLIDREQTLLSVKLQQIRLARRYVLERSRCMDATKPYGDGQRFTNHNGDTCSIRFSMLQLPGSLSVRQVFDVAMFFTENLEISFTDGAGCVTIRENDDSDWSDPTISQHRYLTTITKDTLVEGNLMLFTHYDEEEGYGIVTTTFVDRDDLHPYRAKERLRQDVTAVLLITREQEQIIIRRLGHVRIHHNEHIETTPDMLHQLTQGATRWGDALLKHAKDCYGV